MKPQPSAKSVLFVTRKFPPSVGGMETLAHDVWLTLSHERPGTDHLIAYGGSNWKLPLWIPWMYLQTLYLVLWRKADVVLTGDALMYALLYPIFRLTGMRSATMVMGKDVVWKNSLYRRIVHPPLRHAPLVLAISHATRDSAIGFEVPADRVHVVPLGVEIPQISSEEAHQARLDLRRRLDLDDDVAILLSFGRLVKRKGVAWFIREVMPKLSGNVILLVAGDGIDRPSVEEAMSSGGVGERVRLLGQVDDAEREQLMAGADVMVQPNVPVEGDMEGFGLVTVEAAMRFTLVVAADLEGLRDAVVHDTTGLLIPSGVPEIWATQLDELISDLPATRLLGERFGSACRDRYCRSNTGIALHDRLGTTEFGTER